MPSLNRGAMSHRDWGYSRVAVALLCLIAACKKDGTGPSTTQLTVSIVGTGTVTSVPAAIDCTTANAGTCTADVASGVSVTLTAAPAVGWAFVAWSGNCSGTGSCVVSMTAARSVTATFQQLFRLSISMMGNGSASSSPVGINCTTGNAGTCTADFLSGTQVSLTATPAAGWVFSGWSGSGISCPGTDACAVTMDQARAVTATFLQQFGLTVSGAGSGTGTVTSAPAGINCTSTAGAASGTCTANYSTGTLVTLTAAPAAGSVFNRWGGPGISCPGTDPCPVTMDQARSVTATFVQQFALTLSGAGAGTGTVTSVPAGINCTSTAGTTSGSCTATYSSGVSVTLTATPVAGSAFSNWSRDCVGTGSCVVSMTAARSVTATFQASVQQFALTVIGAGTGTGTVTAVPTGINCTSTAGTTSGTCAANYNSGTSVTMTATPAGGSAFSSWNGSGISCAGTDPCTVTMDQARSVTATFVQQFPLTVSGAGSGTGTVTSAPTGINCTSTAGAASGTCTANYNSGAGVTLTATPATGSVFSGWSGDCTGTGSCLVNMTAGRSVTATFLKTFTLAFGVNVSGGGSVRAVPPGVVCRADQTPCTATYVDGTVVTLTATPDPGWLFGSWLGYACSASDCSVSMTSDWAVIARFVPRQWIQLTPSGIAPEGRSQHTEVYDPPSNRVTVFGGSLEGGGAANDVWLLTGADGTGGTPTWSQLLPAGLGPAPRYEHTAVYDPASNRMIMFGGLAANGLPVNDVWVLTNANGAGGTSTWNQLTPLGTPPEIRGAHTAVYDPSSNRMVVFGGVSGVSFSALNDVWVLTNANGTGSPPSWLQLTVTGIPPTGRFDHSAVYDPGSNQMIVFGGSNSSIALNDVWLLTNANGLGGTPSWVQPSPSGTPPVPRFGHSAVYDAGSNRMILFGGGSFGTGPFNDAWVLSSANGVGSPPAWTQLESAGAPPAPRAWHRAAYSPASNRMMLFGGNDGSIMRNDVWVLTEASRLP